MDGHFFGFMRKVLGKLPLKVVEDFFREWKVPVHDITEDGWATVRLMFLLVNDHGIDMFSEVDFEVYVHPRELEGISVLWEVFDYT